MARRKRNVGKEIFDAMQKSAREREAKKKAVDTLDDNVEVHLNLGARELVTIGSDHPAWGSVTDQGFDDDWKGSALSGYLGALKPGSIVRIVPPPGTSQARIDLLAGAFAGACSAVKVMGKAAPAVPVPEPRKPARARETARQAVLAVAAEVPSVDRKALLELVERTLEEVGL